ncbi:UDP-N-acetylmuramoyl-L-alanyl-D-glutamate--2,6-diaminopimelate ligase [Evansella cellulosilytica]|uniref:UDP-N-acetylmuramoyl-L-alanyl-D-glutamate--2,6-diaminopimelate ligase n=1 Tax=Evansella cellulosilytica (strain ATCC 21833 / DSM 2522 / FERM P-1141 / JCM 9156 / N-4) TaxID=649639 RepID=E6TTT4_EVAC2|nr:UDP-N-acetylmuramoyl-L-alanyl-D-glutamate--2,6-diaminopimelate ligase [Evansella cellulosilytica]ADU30853.1 UDP-N-acetylmuramyl-tripeptide synthetase [Evansella cellulosilytica DSM 2522]
MVQLRSLLNKLPSYEMVGDNNIDQSITDLHMDSREVTQGSLFFCISGYTVDGHDFATQAIEKGTVAIVAEKDLNVAVPVIKVTSSKRAMAIISSAFYDYPSSKLHLIGVTGTNGKTTTTHLIEKILRDAEKNTGIIGTMYMKYKDKEVAVNNTTPESLVLQKGFSTMVQEGVNVVTMEVSSHALELGRVHGTHFNVAVFTNLSQDHLDFHETMENYARAKGLLFAQLGNQFSDKSQPVAVLNRDDDTFDLLETMTAAPIISYGIKGNADLKASKIQLHEEGTSFNMSISNESCSVSMKMAGTFSVYNALAAAAAAYVSGIPLQAIGESLSNMDGVAGRFERVELEEDFHVIVDYAHTPDSLKNVLETIKEFAKGKVSVVVGCGGDRDKTKRPKMAAIAEELSDFVYLTSDNPRSEDPVSILKDMESGMKGSSYKVIVERRDAIYEAIRQAKKDEVILIAGKGHETYQTIGKENHFFDDRLVAKEAVEECQK